MRTFIRVVLRSSDGVAGIRKPGERRYSFIQGEKRDNETALQAVRRITEEWTGVKVYQQEVVKRKTQTSQSGSTGIRKRTLTYAASPPDVRIMTQITTHRPDGSECSITPFDPAIARENLQQRFVSFLETENLLKAPRRRRRA